MVKNSNRGYLSLSTTYLIGWLLILVIFIGLQSYFKELSRSENIGSNFQKGLNDEIKCLELDAENIASILSKNPFNYWNAIDSKFLDSDHFIFVYEYDSLIYWNNNYMSGDISYLQIENVKIIENQSGWYLVKYINRNLFRIYTASLIKSKFNTHKKLNSSGRIFSWFDYDKLEFTLKPSMADFNIYSETDKFILGIKYLDEEIIGNNLINILFALYILGYIFLLLWITMLYQKSTKIIKSKAFLLLFLLIDILILRTIDYYFHIPSILKESYIFENQFNIFPLFNSPGDLLINAILILFIATQIYDLLIKQRKYEKYTILSQIIFSAIVWCISSLVFILIYNAILQLPFSSFYGFEINSLDIVFVFIAILLCVFTISIIFHSVATTKRNLHGSKNLIFILTGITTLTILYFFSQINIKLFIIIACILLLWYLVYQYLHKYQKQEYYKYLIGIILISTATTITINSSRKIKKDHHQFTTLSELSKTHDEKLEDTFRQFEKLVLSDTVLIKTETKVYIENKSAIKEYIIETYFNEIAKKYNIQITICTDDDMLELQPEGYVVSCSDYFESYIHDTDNIKISDNLFLIPEKPESTYYFGRQMIRTHDSNINIYFEFYFTYVPVGLGYPELLISEAAMDIDLSGYSFARYKNDQLVYKYGDFPYYTSLQFMAPYQMDILFNIYNYSHIKHELSDNSCLIISRPNEKLAVQLVSFSTLFILFVTIILIVSLVLFGKQAANLLRMSFQNRLQIIFVSAISAIIVLLASITLYYINIDNQNRLAGQLTEKTNSVIVELQHKLSDVTDLYSIEPVELEILLQKFSMVFFSDINLYSPSGDLISTSRPEIFNRGLLSENINPKAFKEIFINNKLFYITLEELGSVTYYSAYAPLMLNGDQAAGIINLPYFAKQSEVTRSYYQMIFTFINLFVILGIIGTIMVLMLSRLITKPLVVLQKNLAEIQIDKHNEIIKWKGNDEIGQLINAYNQMIVKLEESTELLKQSERESAWREVAQQIAHEIKNPLTPMKLNVQYLEKAFREKDPGLDEKVKNISEMLIAQIESLNKVAEMFSDFTKTKSRKFEKVDLSSMIKKAIQLFKNHSDTVFIFNEDPGLKFQTKAYEKDLLRVFNNLIKNSIQSMGRHSDPVIEIKLSTIENQHIVEFIDNGKGISEDIKTNIFKPYFTTKSTGTGLGLAIVKNIMKEIGGEILLESTSGEGTRFVLNFPSTNE